MKPWRKSLGERGLRVMLFERRPGGPLYREVYVGGKRAGGKKSLRHRDRERAVADGYRLLARLKSHEDAHSRTELTLETLFDIYVESPAHRAKKDRTRREDKQRLRWVVDYLGPDRDVRSLSPDDVELYKQARLRGECGSRKKVGVRTVAADLVALHTAVNWATRQRERRHGRPLLEFNPLRGVKLPAEKNPKRPVETYDRYLKLMEVAKEVDWRLPLALTLAESTGRRIGAILKLRCEDVDLDRLPYGWIRFRAEHDKTGHEQWVPITEVTRRVLVDRLRLFDGEWLFPSERTAVQSVDRSTMDRRLRNAYEQAELKTFAGGLWHPWRRKWATERKDMPVKDVATAGGWSDTVTLLRSYQQADEATVTRVVLSAPKLTREGIVG